MIIIFFKFRHGLFIFRVLFVGDIMIIIIQTLDIPTADLTIQEVVDPAILIQDRDIPYLVMATIWTFRHVS